MDDGPLVSSVPSGPAAHVVLLRVSLRGWEDLEGTRETEEKLENGDETGRRSVDSEDTLTTRGITCF